jgi:amphi-Trp domain-containing protein
MGKNSVALEKKMSALEVVSFMESIIASLKKGKIVLQQGGQFVVLQPGGSITVEVEASQKMEKGKLSVDLKWRQPEESQHEADIIVSSTEPEPEPETEEKTQAEAQETEKKHHPKRKKTTKKAPKRALKKAPKKKARN